MSGYRNILCATDFSDCSKKAVEVAAEMAQRYGAQLTLLHVIDYFPEDRSNVQIAPEDVDPKHYHEDRARTMLAEIGRQLGYDRLVQEVRFSTHSARHEIVHFANEHNTDVIIVACHGHQGIISALGSTAYGVLHSASCDVLTVRLSA